MKRILRLLMYAILGAITGLSVSAIAVRNDGFRMDEIYFWIGIAALMLSIIMIVVSIYMYRTLMTVSGDYTKYMDMDAYDIYRYNKFNDLQVANTFSLISAAIAVAILIVLETSLILVAAAGIVYLFTVWLAIKSSGIMRKLYPDRDLPKAGDKDYAEKLLAASDEGERHIILNGLYKSYNLMQVALFTGIILLIFYSIITGESQIFSIILIGVIMIISQLKYSLEIREK